MYGWNRAGRNNGLVTGFLFRSEVAAITEHADGVLGDSRNDKKL
jgi:hypothetical protein